MANSAKVDALQKPSGIDYKKYYLFGYNLLQTIGWSAILFQFILYCVSPSNKSLYETVKCTLNVFQNAAVLEVLHAATGMVKSNPILTAFQVASRVIVVCAILLATYSARDSWGLPLALTAWSITEIIRYSNYTLNLINSVPYVLKYLRYTTFIVLYPVGITGELLCIWAAQEEVGKGFLYSIDLPNKYNFAFNYQHLLWFLMLLYIPLFPQLYLHMFSQRKKVLKSSKQKSS
ncbi:very-long-chain (3R)-3-hydroxyacyl-CoA dehydratase hpo-8 [Euwallacea similis]|uniref:very-long-chain (3R)-3-hydroxyacyl-CoA dehydratase hpo-8 n=1 Tax=Euwallacea similis TaxID=1736056 RepID=UPI00344D6D82